MTLYWESDSVCARGEFVRACMCVYRSACICVCEHACTHACVCVCVCVQNASLPTRTYIRTSIRIFPQQPTLQHDFWARYTVHSSLLQSVQCTHISITIRTVYTYHDNKQSIHISITICSVYPSLSLAVTVSTVYRSAGRA